MHTAESQVFVPPSIISQLANSFPFASEGTWDIVRSTNKLLWYLPDKGRAWYLAEIYLNYNGWSPTFVSRDELFNDLLTPVYRLLSRLDAEDYSEDTVRIPIASSRLAVLFFVFAHASLSDLSLPRFHVDSEYYFDLGRASLALFPTLTAPDISSVQALGLASLFLAYGGPRHDMEGAWSYMAITVKLSHTVSW